MFTQWTVDVREAGRGRGGMEEDEVKKERRVEGIREKGEKGKIH